MWDMRVKAGYRALGVGAHGRSHGWTVDRNDCKLLLFFVDVRNV